MEKIDVFDTGSVVSYSPCQFPTLGFVVERRGRIEAFVLADFWFLEMMIRLKADGTTVPGVVMNDSGGGGGGAQRQRVQQQGRAINLSWRRGRLYDRGGSCVHLYDYKCIELLHLIFFSYSNLYRPLHTYAHFLPTPFSTHHPNENSANNGAVRIMP